MADEKSETSNAPIVAITGVSGYLGSWCAKKCLAAGFRVRGTVRDASNETKVGHLKAMGGLSLFEADLLKEGSFDKCFAGATYVMHTASPFQAVKKDAQTELIDPALKGTKNVLDCALRAGVQRIVVTSSCAAVQTQDTFRTPEKYKGKVYSEEDWNDSSTLTEGAYRMSKSLAEHACWDFHEKNKTKIEVSVINPAFIIGPPLSKRIDSLSVGLCVDMLNGKFQESGFRNPCFGCVDVRDVAQSHILAMLLPAANGKRFIMSSVKGFTHQDLARMLTSSDEFKKYPVGDKMPEQPKYVPTYSHTRAETLLGLRFGSAIDAFREMGSAVVAFGLVKEP